MDLRRVFHLGPSRTAIIAQLKADVQFLQNRKLMDYSMMIGVHNCDALGTCCKVRRAKEAKTIKKCGEVEARLLYGIRTTDSADLQDTTIGSETDSVLFLGVIDLLQEWTLGKKAEAFVKSNIMNRDEDGLSAVNPERYAERFIDFMSRRLVK
jgi:1-phosphatidylinositol-4-phosphate 5-kinase